MSSLDLNAYLNRIGFEGPLTPSLETLRALHFAHATHIPFENLDVLLGRGIRLDLDSIFQKLVLDRRGGYCFEQNTLFAAVLQELGFAVTKLAARVQMGSSEPRPRTHMLLRVDLREGSYIADVGFGGEGLLHPLPFRQDGDSEAYEVSGWRMRIVAQGQHYTLQSSRPDGWFDLYRFMLEPQAHIDYEVANHYTATHPESRFMLNLVAQLPGETRLVLVNRNFQEITPAGVQEVRIADETMLLEVLQERFGLRIPVGSGLMEIVDRLESRSAGSWPLRSASR
jgi:N-hydroxyarylamine O-acetyltransferase